MCCTAGPRPGSWVARTAWRARSLPPCCSVWLLLLVKNGTRRTKDASGKRLTAVLIKGDPATNSQHGQTSLPHLWALAHIALRLSLPPALRGCGLPPYALCP